VSWVCTHRDARDIGESWQWPATVADARPVVAGWEPTVQRLLEATPAGRLVDWKLVYRDALPRWVSPRGRVALVGDAAHPFLPTSIQGASQAMEDGATLAVCLRRCASTDADGKATAANIPEALQAFEALRYERVRSAQRTGEQTRDIWHRADFDAARKDPASLRLRREAWLLNFDAEAYAEREYDRTVGVLRTEGFEAARALHVQEGRSGYVEYNDK
jgi:2-polyprenyl-6-methoxyphenol hydroxylase-like FAD-dependent oxidoreductase